MYSFIYYYLRITIYRLNSIYPFIHVLYKDFLVVVVIYIHTPPQQTTHAYSSFSLMLLSAFQFCQYITLSIYLPQYITYLVHLPISVYYRVYLPISIYDYDHPSISHIYLSIYLSFITPYLSFFHLSSTFIPTNQACTSSLIHSQISYISWSLHPIIWPPIQSSCQYPSIPLWVCPYHFQ